MGVERSLGEVRLFKTHRLRYELGQLPNGQVGSGPDIDVFTPE